MANDKREQENIAKVSGGHLFVEIVCPKCGGTDSRKTDYRIIAISGIYCPAGCGEMFDVDVENPFADAHAAATAEGIPQADGWVDVADRLPDEMGWYLVTLDTGDPTQEFDVKESFYQSHGVWAYTNKCGVIAWQPKPAPYQRKSEGDSNE